MMLPQSERLKRLNEIAIIQLRSITEHGSVDKLTKNRK